jgi:hypothetical protein
LFDFGGAPRGITPLAMGVEIRAANFGGIKAGKSPVASDRVERRAA